MGKQGLLIGIIGGLGLGLLVGSELSGSTITILGGVLLLFSIIAIISLSITGKDEELISESNEDNDDNDMSKQSYDERRRESKNNENNEENE